MLLIQQKSFEERLLVATSDICKSKAGELSMEPRSKNGCLQY